MSIARAAADGSRHGARASTLEGRRSGGLPDNKMLSDINRGSCFVPSRSSDEDTGLPRIADDL